MQKIVGINLLQQVYDPAKQGMKDVAGRFSTPSEATENKQSDNQISVNWTDDHGNNFKNMPMRALEKGILELDAARAETYYQNEIKIRSPDGPDFDIVLKDDGSLLHAAYDGKWIWKNVEND